MLTTVRAANTLLQAAAEFPPVVHFGQEFLSERQTEHMKATCTFMLIMADQKTARKEN